MKEVSEEHRRTFPGRGSTRHHPIENVGLFRRSFLFTENLYFVHIIVIITIYSDTRSSKPANKKGVYNETSTYHRKTAT